MNSENFLFQAFIYLLAAVATVPLSKRLGLGSVLGYLIAGVIIGPYALGLVGSSHQNVMEIAEFGVVMMLFLVGLELQPSLLWRLRGPILGTGTLQVILTTSVVAVMAILLGQTWGSAVAIGMILSASSTAIALQTLGEKGQLQTKGGKTSFAVLLFQDLAVIPILAIMPLLATTNVMVSTNSHAGPTMAPWLRVLEVLAVVAAIVLGGRFLVRPIFRFLATTHLHEVFTAAGLLLVIGIALAMESIGLSPALGTFLAGVVLADSEYRHELESDIEPFKGLLLGLFFISVGASIDLSLIRSHPLLLAAFVVTLVLTKFIILFVTGKISKLENSQNFTFSLALAQGGEFAFVLTGFAIQTHALNQSTGNLLIATVALSMVVAPFLFTLNERFIQPRFLSRLDLREPDTIDLEGSKVILAGVGRFGVVVARMLNIQKIQTTVLDFDAEQIELVRKLGFKVFYGDATRVDLLTSAGAATAKLLIIAIDDEENSIALVEAAKKHFPNLQLLVRAKSRDHAYRLIQLGVNHIYRETLDSSLSLSVEALRLLGFGAYRANRAAQMFKRYDEKTVRELASYVDQGTEEFIDAIKRKIRTLDELFEAERAHRTLEIDTAWEPPGSGE